MAVNPAFELVNTQAWYGRGPRMIDRLAPAGGALRFLERAGLSGPGEPSSAERARLSELRALLRRLTTMLSGGGALTDADLGALNRYLETPVARRFGADGLRVVPIRSDWPWAMSEIAASFA